MLIGGSGWGTVFCCYLRSLHDSLVTESGCSGDGACKLFWDIKNFSSCCFLVAIKFISHYIGECQCKYAVRFEMKSREEVNRMQLTNQALCNKTLQLVCFGESVFKG